MSHDPYAEDKARRLHEACAETNARREATRNRAFMPAKAKSLQAALAADTKGAKARNTVTLPKLKWMDKP